MIINRLYIKNFGCIKEQTFIFEVSRNVFMLHGRNGRGKSTVLQALSLLLINDVQDTLKDLINWEAQKFELEIEFEYDGHHYFESISCDGAAERLLMVDGNNQSPYKNSDAIKYLASVLEPRMFKSSAFAMQNEIDIIKTTPAERRDYLMRVYDLNFVRSVETLETAQKQVEADLLKLKTDMLGLQNTSYEMLEVVRPSFGNNGFVKRQEEVTELQKFLTLAKSEQESSKALKAEIESLSKKKLLMQDSVVNAEQALTDNQATLLKLADEQKQQLTTFESAREASLRDLKTNRDNLQTLVKAKPTFIEDLTKATLVAEAQSKVYEVNASIKRTEEEIALHKQGKCPTCGNTFQGSDLPKLEDHLRTLTTEQAVVTAYFNQKASEETLYQAEKLAHHKALTEWEAQGRNLTSVENRLVEFELETVSSRQSLLDTHIKYNEQTKKMSSVLTDNVVSTKASLGDIEAQLSKKEAELQQRPLVDETELLSKAERLSAVSVELKSYTDILAANALAEESNLKTAQRQSDDKAKVEQLRAGVTVEEVKLAHHVSAIKIFKRDFPSHVVSSLIEGLVNEMNSFLGKAYDKYQVNLEEVRSGIRIIYGPKNTDVSRASGYEQQVFSSAWRYAREQLTGFGIAFLDEADSASDKGNAELFYRTLMDANLYSDGQLFIISHKQETRELLEQEYEAEIFEIA